MDRIENKLNEIIRLLMLLIDKVDGQPGQE